MSISKWDRIVFKAWLARQDFRSSDWHPSKANLIYLRFFTNIERAERYVTAERMVEQHKHSTYTPYQRASDHAMSYKSYTRKYKYWTDVAENILNIQKEV